MDFRSKLYRPVVFAPRRNEASTALVLPLGGRPGPDTLWVPYPVAVGGLNVWGGWSVDRVGR